MFPMPLMGGGPGMGGFGGPMPMPMMMSRGGPFGGGLGGGGGGMGGMGPGLGMPRPRRASFGGGMLPPGGFGGIGMPMERGIPGMGMPGMPMGNRAPGMGGMGMGGVGMGGMGGTGGIGMPMGGGMGIPMGGGMGGMARDRAGSPGADFDPSRRATSRGRRPSRAARPQTPDPRGRRPSSAGQPQTPDHRGRSHGQARGRRFGFSRSPAPTPRRSKSPLQSPRGVRFNPQHQGARFGQNDAPINMQQVHPHAYGLNPEPRPRTVGEMFRGQDVPVVGFDFVKALTPGGMSTAINLVKSRSDGKLYIEKRIRRDANGRKPAEREIRTLNKITKEYGVGRNLNTLVMPKVIRDGSLYSLILDYCDRGSLMDVLKSAAQKRRPIDEVAMWNVVQGVAQGLAFLHDGIKEIKPGEKHEKTPGWDTVCHLDIKPQNIFLHSQGGAFGLPRVVLADFGCAVSLSDLRGGAEQHVMQPCGTPGWYPPEGDVRNPQYYGCKTDMWALGLTIFVLCRLSMDPNVQRYLRDNICGSRYGQRLNMMARALTSQVSTRRPPARHVASAALKILEEKVQGGIAQGGKQSHR